LDLSQPPKNETMKRREFLKASSVASASGALAACGGRTIKPQSALQRGSSLIVEKSKLKNGQLYIAHPSERFPISIMQLDQDRYWANLMQCSHQKCETQASEEGYICPCHGARYDKQGKVNKGPATVDLPSYQVLDKGEQLWVELNELTNN